MTEFQPSRRGVLKAVGVLSAAVALGGAGVVAGASSAHAASDGFGLRIIDRNESDPRLKYYRFKTSQIGWTTGPGGIREHTAGKPAIVVMPDGGGAGWYSNPVTSLVGPRNWETFHMNQLLPWVEANFRTHAEYAGRAVCGYSMGGFGALKYTAKYYGHFASVSAHSGPPSLRINGGAVGHWANLSSAAIELGGGTVYGVPLWNEARVSADNVVENIERYRHKRIFMVAGTSAENIPWFSGFQESHVLDGQWHFRGLLDQAGIPYTAHEVPGGHTFRWHLFAQDLDGIVAHLKPAE